jgi:hypothetical protein
MSPCLAAWPATAKPGRWLGGSRRVLLPLCGRTDNRRGRAPHRVSPGHRTESADGARCRAPTSNAKVAGAARGVRAAGDGGDLVLDRHARCRRLCEGPRCFADPAHLSRCVTPPIPRVRWLAWAPIPREPCRRCLRRRRFLATDCRRLGSAWRRACTISKSGVPTIGIVGARALMTQFADFLHTLFGDHRPAVGSIGKAGGTLSDVRVSGDHARRLAEHWLSVSSISLEPKRERLQQAALYSSNVTRARLAIRQRPCDWCGALVRRMPSQFLDHVFCTRAHYWAWKRNPVALPQPGSRLGEG